MTVANPPLRIGARDPDVRLLAFHHAGGSAAAFLPLLPQLPQNTETVLFQLPGRGPREEHLRARDFGEAMDGFLGQASETTPRPSTELVDRPVVVLGHSLGALFAHTYVTRLDAAARRHVVGLVLSAPPKVLGRGTPVHLRPAAPLLTRDPTRLEQELRRYGGCPESVLADPPRLAEAVRLYGYDLHLTDTYPGAPPVEDVPVQVWRGASDPAFAGRAEVPGRHRTYPGGHFFLFEDDGPAADLVRLLRLSVHR